jgi:hypothetical protein
MKIILPYRGEFGHKIMSHVPKVNFIDPPKIICCEDGEEALYPGAKHHILVERKNDKDRRQYPVYDLEFVEEIKKQMLPIYPDATYIHPIDLSSHGPVKRKHFIPEPLEKRGITCDIVICPRKRSYGKRKNWPLWNKLVKELNKKYQVFAAGAPDSSFELDCEKAWDYERFLDASIEAMLSAKTVIATDNGLAFLALLCGKSLNLIVYKDGLTAPGYPKIRTERYNMTNHKFVDINIIYHCWNKVDRVLKELKGL